MLNLTNYTYNKLKVYFHIYFNLQEQVFIDSP